MNNYMGWWFALAVLIIAPFFYASRKWWGVSHDRPWEQDRLVKQGHSWRVNPAYGVRGQYTGVGPKGYRRTDERISDDVSDRLADHGELNASDIEVMVINGEVTLRGWVEDRNAKKLAEDIADSVSGVTDIKK